MIAAWVANGVEWVVILTDLKICGGLTWIANTAGLVKFKMCCCDWFDDKWRQRNNEYFLQISKYIVFLQDFANFKTFLRGKNRLKRLKERSKVADVNEGKFVFNIMYCFIIALKTDTMVAYISEKRQHIIWVYFY
jgi:hypothetical protein